MYFIVVGKTIATGLISRIPDYCNSLYHNIAIKDILKFQRVLYVLAMVAILSSGLSHSLPNLKSLHWLPVLYRII